MTQLASVPSGGVTNITVTGQRPAHRSAFHELLSELNPLQYLPVVGTIYRNLTGDRISEEARTVGSLVVSGLTGGPAGVAMSVAAMAVEKLLGVDPEQIGQNLLGQIGLGPHHPHAAAAAVPQGAPAASPAPATAWSPTQLQAYGVTTTQTGSLQQGSLQGADVLNTLELTRLSAAHA